MSQMPDISNLPNIKDITCTKCGTILAFSQAEDRCPGCTRWGTTGELVGIGYRNLLTGEIISDTDEYYHSEGYWDKVSKLDVGIVIDKYCKLVRRNIVN